ncbi:MAG: hypothetical protein Q7S40_04805 [Opitutaceae bacterium]|nr:hypothetical protein [Opitutaceae bacterium]
MPHRSPFLRTATYFLLASALHLDADEPRLALTSESGAVAVFTPSEEVPDQWTWTELTVPGALEPRSVSVRKSPIVTSRGEDMLSPDWSLTAQDASRLVFEQDAPSAGVRVRRVFTFGAAPNTIRAATWVRAIERTVVLELAGLLDLRVPGDSFRETGEAPTSFPLFSENFFAGLEHVSGRSYADGERIYLWQAPYATVGEDWQFIATAIVGWPTASDCNLVPEDRRVRAAFLQYLDTIRVRPGDFELHTNTWWTLPVPFSEADVLKDINALAAGFADRTGMFFDSFALDLGWSDPRSIWRVDANNFPNEFRTINQRLAGLGTGLGLWVSPGSGYPPGLDNQWLQGAGYEVMPFPYVNDHLSIVACFALGGRYQREFKENLLSLVNRYGIRHVKLDYMPEVCDVPTHGHPVGMESVHAIQAGLADVMDSLRDANPNIVLEPLCMGYPPSPWWLAKTPYVLGPFGDDVPYGRVPSPEWMESLISARDIAYRRDRDYWIMPTEALETIDIVVQSPGQFENLAVMAIGRGRWFISTYLRPALMTPQNWDFLAALVRWARANKQYLRGAEMFGGNPEAQEAYGYMFHNHSAAKDVYCARNPWIEQRSLDLPLCASTTETRMLRMIYPRREVVALLPPGAEPPSLVLAPYETVMLELVAVTGDLPTAVSHSPIDAAFEAREPVWSVTPANDELRLRGDLRFAWNSIAIVPKMAAAELCILVQGEPAVSGALASVAIDDRAITTRTVGSAGQFGAAAEPSPENWKWFIIPVAAGTRKIDIDVTVPVDSASVGIFLRGSVDVQNDPAPEEAAVFPTYRPGSRGWSQALLPLTASPEMTAEAP